VNFEQGPIRPPSEAESLFVRLTRNCPWNKCLFCVIYKGKKFSRRPVEEIKKDILGLKEAEEKVWMYALQQGKEEITREVLQLVYDHEPDLLQIAFWLFRGGKNVFLQDADCMILPPEELAEVISFIKEQFPTVERITTYGRSKSIARRSVEQLKMLKEAGLSRIHSGMETGYDPLLEFMHKGVTSEEHIKAGLMIKEAGINLCEYILLGLGGRKYWREHALDTAMVLSTIDPHYVRMRTLAARRGGLLQTYIDSGEFQVQNDDGLAMEERLLLQNFDGTGSIVSDHILNLLEEVQGKLPDDMEKIIDVVNNYLSLPTDERENFSLGRRLGLYRFLKDRNDPGLFHQVEEVKAGLKRQGKKIEEFVAEYMSNYI
jgi:radical SAM superfamily enzyme YgiQ (UPF0313 family)